MEAGASDYLVKGEFTAPVLERSIRYSIMSKRIEQELKQHRSNLEELVRKRTIQHAEARADAERRANEAERRQAVLQALLDHIPVGIAVVDSPDLRVQALSRYALDMVGIFGGKAWRPLTDLDLVLADLGPDGLRFAGADQGSRIAWEGLAEPGADAEEARQRWDSRSGKRRSD